MINKLPILLLELFFAQGLNFNLESKYGNGTVISIRNPRKPVVCWDNGSKNCRISRSICSKTLQI